MKKFIITLLILGFIAVGGYYFYTKVFNKTEKIDPSKDFYVEVTNEYINIREESKQLSNNLGRVKKGEKYLVYDVNTSDGSYIWYKIKYDKDKYGWIANKKGSPYLNEYNNPEDVSNPTIKILYLPYQAKNINSIGFENLEVWDDKGTPEITYEILKPIDTERTEVLSREVMEQIDINIKYDGYIKRQMKQVEQFKKLEKKKLSLDFDYSQVPNLRKEAIQKLNEYQPASIGQASRISGVSPADVSVLLVYLNR